MERAMIDLEFYMAILHVEEPFMIIINYLWLLRFSKFDYIVSVKKKRKNKKFLLILIVCDNKKKEHFIIKFVSLLSFDIYLVNSIELNRIKIYLRPFTFVLFYMVNK